MGKPHLFHLLYGFCLDFSSKFTELFDFPALGFAHFDELGNLQESEGEIELGAICLDSLLGLLFAVVWLNKFPQPFAGMLGTDPLWTAVLAEPLIRMEVAANLFWIVLDWRGSNLAKGEVLEACPCDTESESTYPIWKTFLDWAALKWEAAVEGLAMRPPAAKAACCMRLMVPAVGSSKVSFGGIAPFLQVTGWDCIEAFWESERNTSDGFVGTTKLAWLFAFILPALEFKLCQETRLHKMIQ